MIDQSESPAKQNGLNDKTLLNHISSCIGEPKTLAELFNKTVRRLSRPDLLNFKEGLGWQAIPTEVVLSRAENIALGLYSIGIRKGDRVAIISANSPDWTISDAGAQLSGVIDVPIYTTLATNSVSYILRDSGAKVLFLQDLATFERLRSAIAECSSVEKIVVFKKEDSFPDEVILLSQLESAGADLKSNEPQLLEKLVNAIAENDVATLIYTSGTTGEPKGVMLTHRNLVSNAITAGNSFNFSKNDVPLSVLPLSHVFERTGMYVYLYYGMGVYYAESIEKAADNLKEISPTIFVGVPRIFEKVYARAKIIASDGSSIKRKFFDWAISIGIKYARLTEIGQSIPPFLAVKYFVADRIVFEKLRKFFGGRLRFCITGGAALSENINYIFKGAGILIMQGYGLTETSPVITSNTPLESRVGKVGKVIPGVEIRIAADGEIEVHGSNVMLGYYNKPVANKEAFTADGWFKTGDIGEIDSDGFLKITDRKKELFKTSGGKYIAPALIEGMIKDSLFVNQVVLIGNNRKFPAALIVPNFETLEGYAKEHRLSFKNHAEYCADPRISTLLLKQVEKFTPNLSNYERVKKIILLENEFTVESGDLTPTLKIKRRVIDEKYKDLIDELYA